MFCLHNIIRNNILVAVAGSFLLTACSESVSQDPPIIVQAEDLERHGVIFTSEAGLNVGAYVPLHVKIKSGSKETDLEEVLEAGSIILFFTRSVEWCGFCQGQLKNVNSIASDIEQRGYQILALGYDEPAIQQEFTKSQKLRFKMLSDESSNLIDAFELRYPQYTQGRAVGVPYATVMLIDQDGRIQAKTQSGVHSIRPTNEELLSLIDSI